MNLERKFDFQNANLAHILLPPIHDSIQSKSAEEIFGLDQLLPLVFASFVVLQPRVEEQGKLTPRSSIQIHFASLNLLRKLSEVVLPFLDSGGLILFEKTEGFFHF